MATRYSLHRVYIPMRVFSIRHLNKQGYFLVSSSQQGAHNLSYFAGNKGDLTDILSSWRKPRKAGFDIRRGQVRAFSSKEDESREDVEERAEVEEEEDNLTDLIPHPSSSKGGPLSDITIPDDFPEVPVLSLSRHPLFPKFVKLLEVSVCIHTCSTYIHTYICTHIRTYVHCAHTHMYT